MASQFDITQAAAAVYAESLLQLANEAGKAEEIGQELRDLRQLWDDDPQFAAMMSSAAIDVDTRRGMIKKAFGGGRVSELVLNMLYVLNDKRRSMILRNVCDAYRRKLDKQLGREEVYVTSVVPLTDEQRERIRAGVKRLTGHDADMQERIDPGLLGGITVQVSDQILDMSGRARDRGR
jgi:F-type H+-transporting ATPase subunit delta